MIVLDDVTKEFPGAERPAVGGLSMEIPGGDIVMLVGPSGCGKTTTLRMINRLIEPTSGAILLDGVDVTKQDPVQVRRGIGYVIQRVGLFPHRTIAQNIATVPELLGWDDDKVAERVEELTGLVELEPEMLERYPHELSGGQRQRVGVARALAADPPVLLMDEPFGAVDPIVRGRLQSELRSLQERLHKTIVFVTHDIDEAIQLGDRIAVLNVGGVLEQYCPPEELLAAPANEFVEDFLGGERGLKRLSLRTVGELELEVATTAQVGSSGAAAKERMRALGLEWITVVDGERLVGWVEAKDLDDRVPAEARRFAAHTTTATSLRQALDSVISSRTGVAVVVDDQENLVGMIAAEHLAEQLTR